MGLGTENRHTHKLRAIDSYLRSAQQRWVKKETHQLHAKFVGFVLRMRARGQSEATPPVWGELLLLQLGVETACERHLEKHTAELGLAQQERHCEYDVSHSSQCSYRCEDSRVGRKRLEAATCLQIHRIPQVEGRHCRGDQVRLLL